MPFGAAVSVLRSGFPSNDIEPSYLVANGEGFSVACERRMRARDVLCPLKLLFASVVGSMFTPFRLWGRHSVARCEMADAVPEVLPEAIRVALPLPVPCRPSSVCPPLKRAPKCDQPIFRAALSIFYSDFSLGDQLIA
uniref:Uncharacterized protein n=1 Tax=Steinernema glaseri TaxID=37863 RepID=A0A1I8ALD3_9BILA